MVSKKMKATAITVAVFIILFSVTYAAFYIWNKNYKFNNNYVWQPLETVQSSTTLSDSYNVIVAGTDPEGITAALSAARNGMRVLLVEARDRNMLGGLMTEGGLNTLDLNYSPDQPEWLSSLRQPDFLNKGIFQEWFDQIEGSSFDTHTAANVFYRMIHSEPNIDLLMNVKHVEPITVSASEGRTTIMGMNITKEDGTVIKIATRSIIDATQDADIAAAAGVPYSIGRQDIGDGKSKMVSTLVFKLSGVTDEIWQKFREREGTGVDKMSAWGYGDARKYESTDPQRIKIRSLNIGRQNDDTILINTMQIFGVDPLDTASVKEGLEIGRKEAPLIVDFLKKNYEEFAGLEYAGTADELYVRESRHIYGEYRLTLADVMENRDHWDAIGYGSYDIDIQSTSVGNPGTIMLSPIQYGVPFRSLVPLNVDGLLVVGRAASYDTIPHGSARVVPLGMATGEAAGAAVKLAYVHKESFREISASEERAAELRKMLEKQGMDLSMHNFEKPEYMEHKDYRGLLAAASMYMTSGNYNNDGWDLDTAMNPERYLSKLKRLQAMFPTFYTGSADKVVVSMKNASASPLTLNQAAYMLCLAMGATEAETTPEMALTQLQMQNFLSEDTLAGIANKNELTNGDAYMLIRDVVEYYSGVVFE
ncbi:MULTISPECIES: FAD-dependent oxidoreductase [Paenibacillus]|uniref:FAD dependent oxidoreductase n=1 Tax=Paenibacillus pabuli TaxID=1472 RepID=A0A855Y6S0_9BACL|nr:MULTISPECIES: FAD-dependent oxidoreductase [Paenibacillus]PWW45161.1 FAD dependent oxidoreductase [Paenibacillus pabuli]PXW11498.1 FAD dependent oxidoreductase [Paenibacillus taichungensis]